MHWSRFAVGIGTLLIVVFVLTGAWRGDVDTIVHGVGYTAGVVFGGALWPLAAWWVIAAVRGRDRAPDALLFVLAGTTLMVVLRALIH